MLSEDYLTLRLVRLKPPEEWVHKQGGLCFVFPKGGAGKCLCGPLNQRVRPGEVLVLDGAAGGRARASRRSARGGGVLMRALSLMLLSFLLASCASGERFLQWSARPPASRSEGRVAIKYVINQRAEDSGGKDLFDVGRVRAQVGIPYPVRLDDDAPLTVETARLVKQALGTAGLGWAPLTDQALTSALSIEVKEFWCGGYGVYEATVALQVVVLDARTNGVRLRVPAGGRGHGADCRDAYSQALTELSQDLARTFTTPNVREAALTTAE